MHVIVAASQKGGAGKTTLAAHLAVTAEASGYGPVIMVDTDPQGTLTGVVQNPLFLGYTRHAETAGL